MKNEGLYVFPPRAPALPDRAVDSLESSLRHVHRVGTSLEFRLRTVGERLCCPVDVVGSKALLAFRIVEKEPEAGCVVEGGRQGADSPEYRKYLKAHIEETHVQPILDAVAALPKEELASMARALVNLTSFKRRVTLDAETVGGPIDVAVISKGDGLIWIDRKHYFDPALNHHFFANYFRHGTELGEPE